MRARLAASASLLLSCAPGSGSDSSFINPSTPAAVDTSSTDSSEGSTTNDSSTAHAQSTGDTDTSSEPARLDMGTPPDFPPAGPPGCQGKIDFLFVISDTKYMAPYQQQLSAAIPGFMQTIEHEFAGFDTHILVTNTRGGWGDPDCESCLQCPDCNCEAGGPQYPCGMGPELSQCDGREGAGIVFPAGPDAANHACDIGSKHRYITADTPDPTAALACIAKLGSPGYSSGGAINAMFAALDDDMNGPYGCNAGFLRDDALLVVTLIISSAYDGPDFTPLVSAWMLRDIKGGADDGIVVLTIQNDSGDPDGVCKPYDHDHDLQLYEFADAMTHSLKGSVCADDYSGYFAEAARLARQQCDPVPR